MLLNYMSSLALFSFFGFYLNSFGAIKESESGWSLALSMSQESYAGQAQISEQSSQYNYVIPEFRIGVKKDYFGTEGFFWGYAYGLIPLTDREVVSGAVPELFYSEKFNKGSSGWAIGRKVENWSELDRQWGLGLWQPLVKWDASRPIEQGLTGLFWEVSGQYLRANLMLSGIFLPDQQPIFRNDNGKLTSANRWFREPVPSLGLNRSYYDIEYEINSPDVNEVVFNSSFAASLEFGSAAWRADSAGAFTRFSFSDKPVNQLHIEMDANFDLPGDPYARVYPKVIRHHLYTFEAGYQWYYTRLVASSTLEEYDPIEKNPNNYQSPMIDGRYDGAFLKQQLDPIGLKKSMFTLSYVNKNEKDQSKEFSLVKGDVEASSQRFLFEEMVGFKLEKNFFETRKSSFDLEGEYFYSLSDKGEWFRMAANFRFERDWSVRFAGDIMGVPDDTPTNTSFISRYRGNDRIMGSLTYVF